MVKDHQKDGAVTVGAGRSSENAFGLRGFARAGEPQYTD